MEGKTMSLWAVAFQVVPVVDSPLGDEPLFDLHWTDPDKENFVGDLAARLTYGQAELLMVKLHEVLGR